MIIELLAARRLTQLITEDEITKPLREPILTWGERHEEGTWQDRVAYLVSCPACSSVWAAAGILIARRIPYVRHLVPVLAISQATLALDAWIKAKEAQY
jgi:hypothetical protein